MSYEPRGKIVPLIAATRAEPLRSFTIPDAARICGLHSNKLGGSLTYALRHREIFRGKVQGRTVYRGTPFEDGAAMPVAPKKVARRPMADEWITTHEDMRVPKVVPGWKPPQMTPPRANGGQR